MNVKFEKTLLVLFAPSVRPHGRDTEQVSTVICCAVKGSVFTLDNRSQPRHKWDYLN